MAVPVHTRTTISLEQKTAVHGCQTRIQVIWLYGDGHITELVYCVRFSHSALNVNFKFTLLSFYFDLKNEGKILGISDRSRRDYSIQ